MAGDDVYADDELVYPEWLNNKFFENILKNSENDESIKVKNSILKPATKIGDHYASVMYRATLTYDTKAKSDIEKSLIIKTMPFLAGKKMDMLSGMGIFKAETKMYAEIMPAFHKILKEHNDDTELCGKCLYTCVEPQEMLIFEDLKKRGYDVLPTWKGTIEFAKHAYLKLAKWHALSYKLAYEGNTDVKQFEPSFFQKEKLKDVPMFTDALPNFINMLKTVPEFEKYVDKFERLQNNDFISKCTDIYNLNVKSHFSVLNHGDFHLKNMMYKCNPKDKNEIENLLLVDFQICTWGPAVADLAYSLYLVLDSDTRRNHREEMIYFYFEHLIETLKNIKFSGELPVLSKLLQDFYTFGHYEIMLATTMLPFVSKASTDALGFDPNEAMQSEEYRKGYYYEANYIDEARHFLPYFLHRGYLD